MTRRDLLLWLCALPGLRRWIPRQTAITVGPPVDFDALNRILIETVLPAARREFYRENALHRYVRDHVGWSDD